MTPSPSADELLARLDDLRARSERTFAEAQTATELRDLSRRVTGKNGELSEVRRLIGGLGLDDKKRVGAALTAAQEELDRLVSERHQALLASEPAVAPSFDVTLPGLSPRTAALHPTVQLMYDLNDAFVALNFDLYEGPELSSEEYEFDYLNFPPDHPARESMDTFWLSDSAGGKGQDRLCLRPHLTGASVRYMQEHEPPFRFVYPGRAYRNETTDARHERAFFQYEALIVDERVPFAAGRLLIDTILKTVFGEPVPIRMRAGFFPFVEPGFEIDMQCKMCFGSGCRVCKRVGWIEVMPGGAPHPNVLRAAAIDPQRWMGFYINIGLDRLVMMRYGVDDIRLLHSGDLRFLGQFP